MPPKPKQVDEGLIKALAEIHMSTRGIARIVGLSEDQLVRRYAAIIAVTKERSDARILTMVYDRALNGQDLKAAEMIMKRRGLLVDKLEVTVDEGPFSQMSEDEKAKVLQIALDAKRKRLNESE